MSTMQAYHEFIPANSTDSRAPCPALNALANHGYLLVIFVHLTVNFTNNYPSRPHTGKDIGLFQLTKALHNVYNLSLPFAFFLSFIGILLCGHGFLRLDLDALAAHNKIEHDASLVHADTVQGKKRAPIPVDPMRLRSFLGYAALHNGMYLEDFMHARVDRERELLNPLDQLHAQIGQGEVATAWLVMKDENGKVPLDRLQQWWGGERLPDNWKKPAQSVGLLQTRRMANELKEGMAKLWT